MTGWGGEQAVVDVEGEDSGAQADGEGGAVAGAFAAALVGLLGVAGPWGPGSAPKQESASACTPAQLDHAPSGDPLMGATDVPVSAC
ncbi:MAG: hypothetical protein ACRDRP_23205 [Pseudonocardiaceae bacterium]